MHLLQVIKSKSWIVIDVDFSALLQPFISSLLITIIFGIALFMPFHAITMFDFNKKTISIYNSKYALILTNYIFPKFVK